MNTRNVKRSQPAEEAAALAKITETLKAERVQLALRRLPGWELVAGGAALRRVRRFPELLEARAFVELVCRLASAQRQPVTLRLDRGRVTVTLQGHPVRGCTGGITNAVLDLAELIG